MGIFKKNADGPVAGVDIGSTSINVCIGRPGEGGVELLGVGSSASKGFRRGRVTSIEAQAESVAEALKEAEVTAGCEVGAAYVAIGGAQVESFNTHGYYCLKDGEVREDDILKVMESARTGRNLEGMETVGIVPREFIVDGRGGIRDPRGLAGKVLEAGLHEVAAREDVLHDVIRSVNRAGLKVSGIVPAQLASGEAVLERSEKNQGVILLEVGGRSIGVAAYTKGSVAFTTSVATGMDSVTRDIAFHLKISNAEAERLKRRHGAALVEAIDKDEALEVRDDGGYRQKSVSKKAFAGIIEARVEDVLCLVSGILRREKITGMAGVVLTGGGARMKGIKKVAEGMFGLPARMGLPRGLTEPVEDPGLAAAVGLLQISAEDDGGIRYSAGQWITGPAYRAGKRLNRWRSAYEKLLLNRQ